MPTITQLHRQIINGLIAALLAACSTAPTFRPENMAPIAEALQESTPPDTAAAPVAPPPEVAAALLPQMSTDIAGLVPDIEPRFDISVKATQAPEFFMSLVKGTHLNMVVHPEVSGKISISLRDVTLEEVLTTVRDVYGYRYRRQGNTFQVFPASMRTQVFTVNYLDVVRDSSSRTSCQFRPGRQIRLRWPGQLRHRLGSNRRRASPPRFPGAWSGQTPNPISGWTCRIR